MGHYLILWHPIAHDRLLTEAVQYFQHRQCMALEAHAHPLEHVVLFLGVGLQPVQAAADAPVVLAVMEKLGADGTFTAPTSPDGVTVRPGAVAGYAALAEAHHATVELGEVSAGTARVATSDRG